MGVSTSPILLSKAGFLTVGKDLLDLFCSWKLLFEAFFLNRCKKYGCELKSLKRLLSGFAGRSYLHEVTRPCLKCVLQKLSPALRLMQIPTARLEKRKN